MTVKAIDNDASFSAIRTGAQKYELSDGFARLFINNLSDACLAIHQNDAQAELDNRLLKDPGLTIDKVNGKVTIDLSKSVSPELGLATIKTIGSKSIAMPQEIDKEFCDKLLEMDKTPAKKQAYLQAIAPRISPEALRAAEMRLNDAIAHARKLVSQGKVYSDEHWNNPQILGAMTEMEDEMTIVKSDGSIKTVDKKSKTVKGVQDYVENNTPSFYTRDYFHWMFD